MPRREALRGKRLLAVALGLATGLAMADSDVKYRYVATSAWAEANNYVPEEGAQYDTPQAPALDIQAAIDAAGPGETIRLLPGVYKLSEPIVVSNLSQRVTSWDPATGETAIETTILDGQKKTRCLTVNADQANDCDIEISGLTITNGYSETNGGGVYLFGRASKAEKRSLRGRLVNCRITDCSAAGYGGGVYLERGFMSNCVFTACSADRGGAACLAAAAADDGGLAADFRIPTAVGCDFEGNQATTGGGAICDASTFLYYTYHVIDCRFKDNASPSGRGGHLLLPRLGIAKGCSFSGTGTAKYGAFVAAGYGVTFSRCVFTGCEASSGFGVVHVGKDDARFEDGIVTNNSFSIDFLFLERANGGLLRQSLFADNAQMAAAVRLFGAASVSCESSTFADAKSPLAGQSTPVGTNTLVNCILAGTIMETTETFSAVLTNCYVRTPADVMSEENTNVLTGGKPCFVDAAHGNYALRPSARFREKGVRLDWMTETSTDLAGNPRLVNAAGVANAEDALPDLGCFEVQTPPPGFLMIIR